MRKRESQSVEEALKKLGIQVKGTIVLLNKPATTSDVASLLKYTCSVLFRWFDLRISQALHTKARLLIWNNPGLFMTFQT